MFEKPNDAPQILRVELQPFQRYSAEHFRGRWERLVSREPANFWSQIDAIESIGKTLKCAVNITSLAAVTSSEVNLPEGNINLSIFL